MSTKEKCCERVWDNYRVHPCTKNAKAERDGKWYCGTHDPVSVAARREKSMAAYNAKNAAEREKRDAPWKRIKELEEQRDELLAALKDLCEQIEDTGEHGGDASESECPVCDAILNARHLIAKAESAA